METMKQFLGDERIGYGNPGRTVVAPYEGVAILVLQLAIHVLLGLLHCDVHITIQTSQYTWSSQELGQKKISLRMRCYFSLPDFDII